LEGIYVAEVEIGIGKSGRRAYGLDDITIVPSRRTRDPEDVDISWEIDAYKFELPVLACATDGVVSPKTAIEMNRLGGVGVLNLEGLWTRYEDPEAVFEEIARLPDDKVVARMREIYDEPIKETLIGERIREIKDAGAVAAASLTPQKVEQYAKHLASAELDLFVVHGTVVSAEHLSKGNEPLNLKQFIREFEIPTIVGGCSSYQAALHLMRTGACGILVGVGPGESSNTPTVLGAGVPSATAIADARGARMRHLDETGVYVHVIANGSMRTGGDIAKAVVCGADAVMIGSPLASAAEAPGRGYHWGMSTFHPTLPRGVRVDVGTRGTLEEILTGPANGNDGRTNLFGALRTSMATCGYESLKDFQKAEVMIKPDERSGGDEARVHRSAGEKVGAARKGAR
jgi:IMP dehydrogenase